MKRKAEEKKDYIPRLPDELKYPQSDREKEYLKHIYKLISKLQKDPMTEMEHKEYFESLEKGQGVYIFIDGDGLKRINDELKTHLAGNAAILALAQGIKSALRSEEEATAMRAGGDEFVVHVDNVSLMTGIIISRRILESIRKQNIANFYKGTDFEVKEALNKWQLTASIGVGRTKDEADKAMYLAKERGRNRVEFIKPVKAFVQTKLLKIAIKLGKSNKQLGKKLLELLLKNEE